MKPDELYGRVSDAIASLDFARIWPGFSPLRFALYDDEACFFAGTYIEKPDAFCANTSISYHGETIAIWKVEGELDISVLTAKIVHEMFHGYQVQQGWDCWADEMDALYRYDYSAGNLALRLRENELLLTLLSRFDSAALRELLSHRKHRSGKYPYEFSYESKIEEIEGSATYVEWMVLQQLDERAAAAMTERMRAAVTQPEVLFPIRISCYYTGAHDPCAALCRDLFFRTGRAPRHSLRFAEGTSVGRRLSRKERSPGPSHCRHRCLPSGNGRDHPFRTGSERGGFSRSRGAALREYLRCEVLQGVYNVPILSAIPGRDRRKNDLWELCDTHGKRNGDIPRL